MAGLSEADWGRSEWELGKRADRRGDAERGAMAKVMRVKGVVVLEGMSWAERNNFIELWMGAQVKVRGDGLVVEMWDGITYITKTEYLILEEVEGGKE